MKKTTYVMSFISLVCILICICVTPITASAEESTTELSTIVNIANANDGKLFWSNSCEPAQVEEYEFSVSDVINALLTTSIDCDSNHKTTAEIRQNFCNTENQKMMVYEDIITGETTVFQQHKEGYATYKFDCCHSKEDIHYVLSEFNYQGFRYSIYVDDVNDVNAKSHIAKTWDPQPNSRVYDCTSIKSEVDMKALKSLLRQAFSEGTNIDFIQESNNGRIHGFVNNNGQKEEFIFERYNQKPFGEELPEIIAWGISGETKQDDYSIIVEDGVIRIESAKRSGYLDHNHVNGGWKALENSAK